MCKGLKVTYLQELLMKVEESNTSQTSQALHCVVLSGRGGPREGVVAGLSARLPSAEASVCLLQSYATHLPHPALRLGVPYMTH